MASFLNMLNIQMVLIVYVACGVLCRKLGIITEGNQQKFVSLVLNILMPCMVFNSFKSITADMLVSSLVVLAVSFAVCGVSSLLGKVLYRRFPVERRQVLRYGTLINNAGFAGLPLAQQAFGDLGLAYASVFLIPIRIFMWSSGITLLSGEKVSPRELAKKLATNPNIIAVVLGMARGLLQVSFPPFAETALSSLSACVSPLSMIIIGAIIADVDPRTILERGIPLYTFVRLVGLPLLVLAACKLIGFDATVTGTCVTLTAMPAATTTALLAARYGSDVSFASKMVFVTTVLSLVTAPALMLLIGV